MRLTKTTLKELTQKYRAVLVKCAMLNAIACGLLYSGNALAVDTPTGPIVIYSDGTTTHNGESNSFSHAPCIGVSTFDQRPGDDVSKNLDNYVTSIKTDGIASDNAYGIKSSGKDVNASSILDGINIQAYGEAGGIGLLSSEGQASHIKNLGNIVAKSKTPSGGPNPYMAYGIRVSNSGDNKIEFNSSNSFIEAESMSSNVYGVHTYGGGKLTITNLGRIEAKTSSTGDYRYAYGIYGGGESLTVNFSGIGQAITATATDPSKAYSIYAEGGTTNVNLTVGQLSGKIHNEATLNLKFDTGATWKLKAGDVDGNVSNLTLNGGVLDLRDRTTSNVSAITKLTLTNGSTSLLYVDVDLAANTPIMDTLTTTVNESGKLHIAGLNLISEALLDETSVTFTTDDKLKNATQYTGPNSYVFGKYTYAVTYEDGKFVFNKTLTPEPQQDSTEDIINGVVSSAKSTVNSVNGAVNVALRGRLTQLSGSPAPTSSASSKKGQSGGDEDETYGLWAQAIYSHVNRDKTGSSAGFKGHSEGVVLGADAEVAENVIAGFAYAYTNSNMKSNGAKSNIDTHGFYAYGQYKPSDWFINGSIGFGLSKADPKGSDKDIKSKFYSIDALAGYEMNYDFGNLTPAGGLRYVRIEQDSYRENGSKIEAKDADTLTAVVQLGWNNVYQVAGKEITPKASVGFIYDVKSENNKVTVSSAGAKFLTEDGRLKRFGTEVSVGADAKLTNNWNVSLDYTGEFRQHYENHTGTVSVRYDF
ncbi:MAG: autotransporter domain-containing protein [Alphaproteobacteria bacterium]|nr:autotransporter domain-containing protein [Alphaproteobacteria bacterium]